MRNNINATVIYLRSKSIQPVPGPHGEAGLPRKGAPIGAIAYIVEDGLLEVSFSLLSTKHEKNANHDTWNRERCAKMVIDRLEKKRETCTRQIRQIDGSIDEYETGPKYFRLEIPEPILSTDPPTTTRPYDVLNFILVAASEKQIDVPPRLVKTLTRMIIENAVRTALIKQSATERSVLVAVRKLQGNGVAVDAILDNLELLAVATQPTLPLAEASNTRIDIDDEHDVEIESAITAATLSGAV